MFRIGEQRIHFNLEAPNESKLEVIAQDVFRKQLEVN